ncbi:MAG: hypothetical protein OJF49_001668 [Ktedonobacterales bacterium]|jgi:hypothetical protein|nr:MAG: hypothetical protein OJF49_001668 [Ktedonobacterales bacterium]
MDEQDPGLTYAAAMLDYGEHDMEEQLERLHSRWGSPDVPTLMRMHHEAEGNDRLFALFALGCRRIPQARDYLASLMESSDVAERQACRIALAHAGDKRAVQPLMELLGEFLPGEPPYDDWREQLASFLESWQADIPGLLGRLGDPVAAPALRRALQATIAVTGSYSFNPEAILFRGEIVDFDNMTAQDNELLTVASELQVLLGYQDGLVYALGQLGAVGALTGVAPAHPERATDRARTLALWTVHLLMGYLHERYPVVEEQWWQDLPELRADLDHFLERLYGLDLETRNAYLQLYEREKLLQIGNRSRSERMAREYGWYG